MFDKHLVNSLLFPFLSLERASKAVIVWMKYFHMATLQPGWIMDTSIDYGQLLGEFLFDSHKKLNKC